MKKNFKLLGIIFLLSLIALLLAGCDSPSWESASTLVLKVDSPSNGASVNTPTVTVSGRLGGSETSAAKVTINGADIPVKDRKFSTDVKLVEGKNVVSIGATIKGGADLKEEVVVTYASAK